MEECEQQRSEGRFKGCGGQRRTPATLLFFLPLILQPDSRNLRVTLTSPKNLLTIPELSRCRVNDTEGSHADGRTQLASALLPPNMCGARQRRRRVQRLYQYSPPPLPTSCPPPTPLTYFPSNCDTNAHRSAHRPQVRGRRSPSENRKRANCPHYCLTDDRTKKEEGKE